MITNSQVSIVGLLFVSGLFTLISAVQALGQTPNSAHESRLASDRFVSLAKKYGVVADAADGVVFKFKAIEHRFGHLSKPWETRELSASGMFWFGSGTFFNRESVIRGSSTTQRETVLDNNDLFRTTDDRPAKLTASDSRAFLRESCRYTPVMLLRHIVDLISNRAAESEELRFSNDGTSLHVTGSHSDESFKLEFVHDELVSVTWSVSHEMFGDQQIAIKYSNLKNVGGLTYPSAVVEETFGVQLFSLEVLSASQPEVEPEPIEVPDDYELALEPVSKELVEIDKYSDRITFLHLTHTNSRTTVVEFKEFLLVIDAPISSRNGQLILDTIEGMDIGKPVKLFAFGHHHPHYLGGVRSFVAAGAKILTTSKTVPYLKQLVSFSHTSPPDALQERPKELLIQEFEDETTIGDDEYEVRVYDMGLRSKHTIDYLLFYFPEEKMVLQDDGVRIRVGLPPTGRTRAVYDEIRKRKLDVVDCIQGWPTQNYGVKTKLKYSELDSYIKEFDLKDSQTVGQEKQETESEVFARLQSLAGRWKHESKEEFIDYKMISKGSALVEDWSWPKRGTSGMTVYHMDVDTLMATHYCPAGNQPRLLFDGVDKNGSAVFEFKSATNLPNRGKNHCVSFWIRQEDDVLFRSETYVDESGSETSESRYLRVKAVSTPAKK